MYHSRPFNSSYIFLVLLLSVCVFNVFFNSITLPLLAVTMLVFNFIFQKKEDWAFLLVMYSTVFGGYFAQLGIRGMGWLLLLLGLLVLVPDLLRMKLNFQRPRFLVFLTLLFLLVSVLTTSGGDYAFPKFFDTIITTVCFLVAFGHLLTYPERHDGTSLSLMLLAFSAFMLSYITDLIGGLTLLDVISFGSFRSELSLAMTGDEGLFTYNYQTIGLYACVALCLYFVNKKRQLNLMGWLIVVTCGLIVLCCQSRQGLFSYLIVLVFLLIDIGKISPWRIFIPLFIVLIFYYWINTLDDTVVEFVTGQNEFDSDSRRSIIREAAYKSFLSSPLTGVGYGRFFFENGYGENIHNLAYEILAETGIIGAFYFSIISLLSFKGVSLKALFNDYYWLVAIIIAFLLRLMISSDLREGIGLFVIFFLIKSITKATNKKRIET